MALINWTRVFAGQTAPLMSYLDDNFNQINTTFGAAAGVSAIPTANFVPLFDTTGRLNTNAPAFNVEGPGGGQVVTNAVSTKMQWTVKNFDTHGYFDNVTNYRFTPLIAGKYTLSAHLQAQAGTNLTGIIMSFFKNGVVYKTPVLNQLSAGYGTTAQIESGTVIIDMNGTTDYVEVFVTLVGTGTLTASASGQYGGFFGSRVSI